MRAVFALLLTCLVVAGCDIPNVLPNNTNPPTPTSAHPTPTRPARSPSGTLTIRLPADVTSLNPWLAGSDPNSQMVTGLIFSGLTKLDNHLQPQPDLAESWDISDDGTSITFHLRKDAVWHDGKPFTAQDVVWSYNTLARLPAGTPSLLHIQDTVKAVQAVDPVTSTVRFDLNSRYSPIMADLSMPILPSHILSGTTPDALQASAFNNAPVGTGPFSFEERRPGQSITLKTNAHFYSGQPLIERVGFVVAPDEQVVENAVKNGTLMLAQLSPLGAESLVTGGGMKGGAYDEAGYDFVAFNLRPGHPFSDTRLRQAWAWALDKAGLVYSATGGSGDPVWDDVTKASWAYNPNVPKYAGNPDKARQLLASAGWTDTNGDGVVDKDGKPLEVSLYVRSDDPVRQKAAANMSEQLAKVGIRAKVQPADFKSSLLARVSPNAKPPFDFDVIMLGWTRLGTDPDPFALFHSSQIPSPAAPRGLNFTGFSAPEYDNLVIQGRSTYDTAQRKQIYARTQEIIADQLPYYFLWAAKTGVVASPKLQGDIDFASPRFLWNVEQWWIQ